MDNIVSPQAKTMKAALVSTFGGYDQITLADLPTPTPGPGQVLVRVAAAGVGPWDGWILAGKSALPQPLPLTLGADFAGEVVALGAEVAGFSVGDKVYGVVNPRFTGAWADYAVAEAGMIARAPNRLSAVEAASAPIVAATARQALFTEAGLKPMPCRWRATAPWTSLRPPTRPTPPMCEASAHRKCWDATRNSPASPSTL
jgi:NADPH:quinone reductase-like Zn-dependent oxidoreductase